jgi:hypothetical protein
MAVRYGGAAVAATAAATFGRRDIGSGLSNKNWGERWSDKFSQMSGVKNETKSSIIGGVLGYNPPRNSIPLHVSRLNQKLGNTDINGKAAPFGDFKNAVAGTGGYVADDKNGNTWAVTTNKPSYGEFQTYQPKDGGKTYYVQNLTETAAQYQAATGKAYGPLETAKAEAKYGASHNFSGLYVSPSQGYPGQGQGAPVNEAPVANGAGVVVGANEPAVSDGGIYAPQSNQTIYGGESSTENQGNINSEDNAVYENVSAMFEGHPNTVDNTGIPNDGNATFDTGAAFEGNVPNTHQSDNPVNVYGGQQYVSQKGGDYTENTSNIDASTVFEPSSPNVAQPQNPVSIKEQAVPSPQNVNVDGSVYLKEPVVDTSGMTSGNVPVGEQNLDGNVGGYTRRAPSNHDIGSKYKGRQRNNT